MEGSSSTEETCPLLRCVRRRNRIRGVGSRQASREGLGDPMSRNRSSASRRVRVFARPASSLTALEGCAVEVVRGDILQPDSVARAIHDCAQVFHVAADHRLWAKNPGEISRNNVDGTRAMLEARMQARGGRGAAEKGIGQARRCESARDDWPVALSRARLRDTRQPTGCSTKSVKGFAPPG